MKQRGSSPAMTLAFLLLSGLLAPFFTYLLLHHFQLLTTTTSIQKLADSTMIPTQLIACLGVCAAVAATATPIVKTHNGSISGLYIEEYNQDAYLGIPYAQPPVGSLRFSLPAPYNESWGRSVRSFDKYSPACWSSSGTDTLYEEHSEDCLTLNVVKPHGDYRHDLPVAIWIHGGGFQDGSASRQAYNLSFIVEKSVEIGQPFIGVSINYRLGGFGFLNSREVGAKGWTNVGLRDQIKAIEWVHKNIAGFGGDPEHIVLWGESAGAMAVGRLLTSDKLGSYIKGGIMQSGNFIVPGVENSGSKQTYYDSLVSYFDCDQAVDSLECLQGIDAQDLDYAFNVTNGVLAKAFSYFYVDGDVVRKSSYQSLLEGDYYKVPVLVGANTDEGTGFTTSTLNSTEQVFSALKTKFPYLTNTSIETIQSLYPNNDSSLAAPLEPTYNVTPIVFPSTFGDYFAVTATAIGDINYIAPQRFTTKILSADRVPVYKYRFNIPDKDLFEKSIYYGSAHFQEVVYVFNNNQQPNSTSYGSTWHPDPRSANISSTISKLWASFISDLDPNVVSDDLLEVENRQGWPAYFDSQQNLVFDLNGFYLESDDFREEQFEFIESIRAQLTY